MSSSSACTREALTPKSGQGWREAERTSTRVPPPTGVMRMTTSSGKPMISERATASIAASRRPAPAGCASAMRHLRLVDQRQRDVVRPASAARRIAARPTFGKAARCNGAKAVWIGGHARARARQHVEARRIGSVGGDVVDRRQLPGAGAEIGRIGEQREAEQQSRASRGRAPCGPAARSRRRRRRRAGWRARQTPAPRRRWRAPARSPARRSAR